METKLYSVEDIKTQIFHPPQFCHNVGHALRFFTTQFQNPDSIQNRYPDDFRLYEIGTYNDLDARIKGYATPKFICSVRELLEQDQPDPINFERLKRAEGTDHNGQDNS